MMKCVLSSVWAKHAWGQWAVVGEAWAPRFEVLLNIRYNILRLKMDPSQLD